MTVSGTSPLATSGAGELRDGAGEERLSTALEVHDLVKSFSGRRVVDGVSFDLHRGEIFGFLGPNGSGKTTTMRMALDLIRPDSGVVGLLGGTPTREALRRVGYLPEERGLLQQAHVLDVLRYLGRLKGLDASTAEARVKEMLDRVGLVEHLNAKVQELSRGMSQLVQFAGALLHEPELIILDEPFSGLDPLNVVLMKDIIREEQRRGASIIFSTHIMSDVEEMCERVLLIDNGEVLVYGPLMELKRARGTSTVSITAEREPTSVPGVTARKVANGAYQYHLGPGAEPKAVLRSFIDADIDIQRFEVALPTLNEIFIEEVSRARNLI